MNKQKEIIFPPQIQQSIEIQFGKGLVSREGDDTYHLYKGLLEGYSYILLKNGKQWLDNNFPVIKECIKCELLYYYCGFHEEKKIEECKNCGNKELDLLFNWNIAWDLLKNKLPAPLSDIKKYYVNKDKMLNRKNIDVQKIEMMTSESSSEICPYYLDLAFLKAFIIMASNLKTHRIPREHIRAPEFGKSIPFQKTREVIPDDITRTNY